MSTHNYCQTGQKWPKLKPPRLIFQCRCKCSEHTVHSYTQDRLDLETSNVHFQRSDNLVVYRQTQLILLTSEIGGHGHPWTWTCLSTYVRGHGRGHGKFSRRGHRHEKLPARGHRRGHGHDFLKNRRHSWIFLYQPHGDQYHNRLKRSIRISKIYKIIA